MLECRDCNFKASSQESIREHQSFHIKRQLSILIEKEQKQCKAYTCNDCDYSTESKISLSDHFKSVHEKLIRFRCNICDFKSFYSTIIKNHGLRHRNETFKIIRIGCEECEINNTEHKLHKNHVNRTGKFKCNVCRYTTDNQKIFYDHCKSVHEKIFKYRCNICDYKSYFKQSVEKHKHRHKNEVSKVVKIGCTTCRSNYNHHNCDAERITAFNCKVEDCQFSCDNEAKLKQHHEHRHLKVTRYSCNICGFKAYFEYDIASHQKSSHEEIEDPIILKIGLNVNYIEKLFEERSKKVKENNCNECDHKPFQNRRLLMEHYTQEHPGKQIFNCLHCDYGTNYLPHLNHHTDSKHKKKKMCCPECPYVTTWYQQYRAHIRIEHGQFLRNSKYSKDHNKTYLCDDCGYFSESGELFKRHVYHQHFYNSHKGVKKVYKKSMKYRKMAVQDLKCCGKIFKSVTAFIYHKNSKHENLKFNCEKCDFQTTSKPYLKQHTKLRHDKKTETFRCYCGSEFKNQPHLRYHMKTKHGGIYSCMECYYQATTKKDLKLHHDSKHNFASIPAQENRITI